MSIDLRNLRIICDGDGCGSTLAIPLKMRQSLDAVTRKVRAESPAAGWTFLHDAGNDRHYCPACACKELGSLVCDIQLNRQYA